MATSFADGTKMSLEMALVANATGLRAARRGMYGPDATTVHEAAGAVPARRAARDRPRRLHGRRGARARRLLPRARTTHPAQKHWLEMYKLGEGPLYTFYTPVPPVPSRGATHRRPRRALRRRGRQPRRRSRRSTWWPPPSVISRRGRRWTGSAATCSTGLPRTPSTARLGATLLPVAIAEGCTLVRDVAKDELLRMDDVGCPAGPAHRSASRRAVASVPPDPRTCTWHRPWRRGSERLTSVRERCRGRTHGDRCFERGDRPSAAERPLSQHALARVSGGQAGHRPRHARSARARRSPRVRDRHDRSRDRPA